MYLYSKDIAEGAGASGNIHSLWLILIFPNILFVLHWHMCLYSNDIAESAVAGGDIPSVWPIAH
jgi:hypothetical protein